MATQPTTFFGQLLARLFSETPVFFKKIIAFGISLGATGATILAIDITKLPITLPAILTTISGYMVAIGVVCTAVAKSATTDPDLQAKGGSNVDVNDGGESKVVDKAP